MLVALFVLNYDLIGIQTATCHWDEDAIWGSGGVVFSGTHT